MFAAPAVKIGHELACVASSENSLDVRDRAAGFGPGACRIVEVLEPSAVPAVIACATGCRRCLQRLNFLLQTCISTQAKDIAQVQLVTQVQTLPHAVMAICPH